MIPCPGINTGYRAFRPLVSMQSLSYSLCILGKLPLRFPDKLPPPAVGHGYNTFWLPFLSLTPIGHIFKPPREFVGLKFNFTGLLIDL